LHDQLNKRSVLVAVKSENDYVGSPYPRLRQGGEIQLPQLDVRVSRFDTVKVVLQPLVRTYRDDA
jgi:hypothetical protein